MARGKGFDDAEVVAAARRVFWQRGYTATSLAQLLAATGLNKSSLYESYGSKRGLFDRAMQSYLNDIMGPLLVPLEQPTAGKPELMDYFRTFSRVFRSPVRQEATRGCFMLNTAMELNDLDEVAATEVNAYRVHVRAALFNAARSLNNDGRTPQLRADILTAAQIGMMITSRMDPERAAELADAITDDISTW